ncbi:hypothetical protein WH87_14870 [Devosia epidermidihirudinis]|uniref:DUF4345 domain-containing protein n=1 Tax=Devosia epidermidihirudinis TaxID=1293439 RepID=A0A0F5Q730_9HYPH|nr:hypothetical protein [Devosia epidermidihirudinis]KKC35854.1 hypothetical protein WH87_14870 [Devosia epidermidihirudinis]
MLAVLIVVTAINALVSTGFSVAAVFFPAFIVRGGERSHTARVLAYYGLARSVSLLLIVLWAAFRIDTTALLWLGTLAGLIQLGDAAIGTQTGDQFKIWGPLGLGVVQLAVVLLAFLFGA